MGNKLPAIHSCCRTLRLTYGAMPFGYCALRGLTLTRRKRLTVQGRLLSAKGVTSMASYKSGAAR